VLRPVLGCVFPASLAVLYRPLAERQIRRYRFDSGSCPLTAAYARGAAHSSAKNEADYPECLTDTCLESGRKCEKQPGTRVSRRPG
jgi:hypothetical protein